MDRNAPITSKAVFHKRSAKMIDGTEKPKIPLKFAKRAARYNEFGYKVVYWLIQRISEKSYPSSNRRRRGHGKRLYWTSLFERYSASDVSLVGTTTVYRLICSWMRHLYVNICASWWYASVGFNQRQQNIMLCSCPVACISTHAEVLHYPGACFEKDY